MTIPAEIDGKKVLEISDGEDGDFIFYDFERGGEYIKEITLPEGLERIGLLPFHIFWSNGVRGLQQGLNNLQGKKLFGRGNKRIADAL